jgi:uncharacterized protein with PhoU and TrkA domain
MANRQTISGIITICHVRRNSKHRHIIAIIVKDILLTTTTIITVIAIQISANSHFTNTKRIFHPQTQTQIPATKIVIVIVTVVIYHISLDTLRIQNPRPFI